ncbi:hypothetical protein [Sphingobium chungbukense]|nr:hypothetical protein [Sphingobium chungbukense]
MSDADKRRSGANDALSIAENGGFVGFDRSDQDFSDRFKSLLF